MMHSSFCGFSLGEASACPASFHPFILTHFLSFNSFDLSSNVKHSEELMGRFVCHDILSFLFTSVIRFPITYLSGWLF